MIRESSPRVSVVMRSYNDAAVVRDTLEALRQQTDPAFELWNYDSSSTDGTLDVIREFNVPERIVLNDSRSYNPGRVLNEAVARCSGRHRRLHQLRRDSERPVLAAATHLSRCATSGLPPRYGRQSARPDARSLFVKDTERAFGAGHIAGEWTHFFSMANSAVRRSVALEAAFRDAHPVLRGHRLVVPRATRRSSPRLCGGRRGRPLAQLHARAELPPPPGRGHRRRVHLPRRRVARAFLGYCVMPFGMEVLRDLRWAVRTPLRRRHAAQRSPAGGAEVGRAGKAFAQRGAPMSPPELHAATRSRDPMQSSDASRATSAASSTASRRWCPADTLACARAGRRVWPRRGWLSRPGRRDGAV